MTKHYAGNDPAAGCGLILVLAVVLWGLLAYLVGLVPMIVLSIAAAAAVSLVLAWASLGEPPPR